MTPGIPLCHFQSDRRDICGRYSNAGIAHGDRDSDRPRAGSHVDHLRIAADAFKKPNRLLYQDFGFRAWDENSLADLELKAEESRAAQEVLKRLALGPSVSDRLGEFEIGFAYYLVEDEVQPRTGNAQDVTEDKLGEGSRRLRREPLPIA